MKILLDCRFYGLENAGLGRYTINVVDTLSRLDSKNIYYLLLRKKYFDTLKLPANFHKVLADVKHYSIKEQLVIPGMIKRINPDLSHFMHFNVPLLTPKPFIVTIHDMIMHKSKGIETTTLSPFLYFLKRFFYRFIFRVAVRGARKIITPTKTVKDELRGYFNLDTDKIVVTYLGIDKAFINSKKYPKKNYCFYVGNAYPHKNLKRLVSAVKKINAKLILATPKNIFTKRLQDYVNEIGADQNVEIKNFLSDDLLQKMYSEANLFVYPSLIEGFGFQGLEALLSGTRILVSDIPVFREVYGEYANYFDPLSVESIAGSIAALTKKEMPTLSLKDKEVLLQKYSWENTARNTLSIYESIRK